MEQATALPGTAVVCVEADDVACAARYAVAFSDPFAPDVVGPEQLGHIGEIMQLWVHSADVGRGVDPRPDRAHRGCAYTFAGDQV